MFITKMALPRRAFLRGTGAMLALPLLDAMVPALSAITKTAANPVRRLGCIYIPNGVNRHQWVPDTVGAGFELSPTLSPLASVKDRLIVLSGLAHMQGYSLGDGNSDHPRSTAVWLSGVHAWTAADGGSRQIQLGTTVDQHAANEFGKQTLLPSVELTLESASQIACDTSDCFFSNTISWRNPLTPLPMEPQPRVLFERLFGDGSNATQRRAQIRKTGSILDSVTRELVGLQGTLGTSDRTKLNEYLEAVRDIEQRIQISEKRGAEESSQTLPEFPTDIPEEFEEYAKLMLDLQTLAYQADITRVFTMMLGRETSGRTFANIGVPEQHHSVSHHLENPDVLAKKAKIDKFHIQLLAYFLEKLRTTPDGDGSLLDHVMILYGGGMGDGNQHDHINLPVLLAGGGAGQLKGGYHLKYPESTPMANLLLSLLDKLGVPTPEKIGDSTEHLSGL